MSLCPVIQGTKTQAAAAHSWGKNGGRARAGGTVQSGSKRGAPARGTRRVRLVRGEGRGVSTEYEGGGGGGGTVHNATPHMRDPLSAARARSPRDDDASARALPPRPALLRLLRPVPHLRFVRTNSRAPSGRCRGRVRAWQRSRRAAQPRGPAALCKAPCRDARTRGRGMPARAAWPWHSPSRSPASRRPAPPRAPRPARRPPPGALLQRSCTG